MYNLIEYSSNVLKTSESLWKYYRNEPALTNPGAIANSRALFKFKQKIAGENRFS